MKLSAIPFAAVALFALAGCTEKPQTLGSNAKVDAAAYQGTGAAFTATGWKPGEKVSWEQQLKTRTMNGQNEYTKVK